MTHVLIVESSSPKIASHRRQMGRSAPQNFERAFRAVDPSLKITTHEPYLTPFTAQDLDGVDGVVMTGQGDPWPADAIEAEPIRDACELVFKENLPTIGVCFGLQIATLILGGEISASPNGIEAGIARDIYLTEAGKKHPMMASRHEKFASTCAHRDEVSRLPEGAVLLAGNEHTKVQAMGYSLNGVDFWGIQYHPELTPRALAGSVRDSGSMFSSSVPNLNDVEKIETDIGAADRLGVRSSDFAREQHTIELRNWLYHVVEQSRRDSRVSAKIV